MSKGAVTRFLSHLCGEEDDAPQPEHKELFLSHLCGEEGLAKALIGIFSFLSHLCGEEVVAVRSRNL